MDLVALTEEVQARGTGNLVAIGKWDGVHLAHQEIISALVAEARRTGGQAVVMGFHPMPMTVLRPDEAPCMLQTLEERSEVLAAMGVDVHLVLPFDPAFSAMLPARFVQEVLVDQLRARQVMAGFNFTFGRGGKGTVQTLRELAQPHQIPVRIFDPIRINGENVSSTEVRLYVSGGDMRRANALLGRPYAITGMVVGGDKRGRLIGYPTANLHLAGRRHLPAHGVYVARVTVLERQSDCGGKLPCKVEPRGGRVYGAMLNLGRRPTFAGVELRCEVHLFDFQGDLYGRELRVEFCHRLRGEQAFTGLEALTKQLVTDEAEARAYLVAHE